MQRDAAYPADEAMECERLLVGDAQRWWVERDGGDREATRAQTECRLNWRPSMVLLWRSPISVTLAA